ncbi:unnamed protein product, partial [Coregonus sp. 'balchen']
MVDIQCLLDGEGASELVIDLIVSTKNDRMFEESILLGNALLQGGNTQIQLHKQKKSEHFFKVFYDRMRLAQQEIRATVSVNMFEVSTCRKRDEDVDVSHSGIRLRRTPKDSSLHMIDNMRGQLKEASSATSKAFVSFRKERDTDLEVLEGQAVEGPGGVAEEREEETQMSRSITIMKPILRYLQLLCENHNRDLQNFLRNQNNKTNYNLVCETLQFLDIMCGSTTGGLGLLGLYINEGNVDLVRQTLETITEYCQGPCHENQSCIAKHESNGIDIIIALIVNPVNPLGKHRLDLVLELKLARHSKFLQQSLRPPATGLLLNHDPEGEDALGYYANHTAQIEIVRHDRTMEQIVFPVPNICEYLTEESKTRVFTTTERDDQGSKVNDFFTQFDDLYNEMRWQKKIRSILPPFLSILLWVALVVCTTMLFILPKPGSVRPFLVSVILRSIYTLGLGPTLLLLGAANLLNKMVFLVSFVGNQGTFTRGYKPVVMDMPFLYHVGYVIVCMLGLFVHEFFYSFLLFDLLNREETLLNVIKSVTRNGRSIVLTAVLALILVYLFSIVGFLFLKDDFRMDVQRLSVMAGEDDGTERVCDTLLMCIVTVLNQGLRNGGGVGDVLRKPSKDKQRKEEILKTTCFICGLERDKFDNKTVSFEEHITSEHNMWHYLYFLVLVRVKDPTEYTGPESYVAQMIKVFTSTPLCCMIERCVYFITKVLVMQ